MSDQTYQPPASSYLLLYIAAQIKSMCLALAALRFGVSPHELGNCTVLNEASLGMICDEKSIPEMNGIYRHLIECLNTTANLFDIAANVANIISYMKFNDMLYSQKEDGDVYIPRAFLIRDFIFLVLLNLHVLQCVDY